MENAAYQLERNGERVRRELSVDDIHTQFSELIDGPMLVPIELRFDGYDLYGEDGSSMGGVIETGLNEAKQLVRQNPNLWFEIRRRSLEREEYEMLLQMARGERPNTMVVVSDFPPELMSATKDVGGYNVTRKQTMLRVMTLKPNGAIQMYSQSLDGSNREALEAIYAFFNQQPEPGELLGQRINVDVAWYEMSNLVDKLRDVYDQTLARHGGQWYAGRPNLDLRNTYDFVRQQKDLIDTCLLLDQSGQLNDEVLFNIAATIQARYVSPSKESKLAFAGLPQLSPEQMAELFQEMETAGAAARLAGKTFDYCGKTLNPGILDGSTKSLLEAAGYGNKSKEDKFGPLTFKCPNGHINKRPYGKLIEACQHPGCRASVKC